MNTENYYPTINQSFWLITKLILISIPANIPLIVVMEFKDLLVATPILKSAAIFFSYLITFLWILWIAKRTIRKQGLWEVKWKTGKISIGAVVVFSGMTIALGIVLDPLTELTPMPESIIEIFKELIRPDVFSFLSVVVLAPILEELFFRGVVLEGFLKNYSPWKSIVWSAVIFGMAHLNPWQAIGGIFIGILLGWAYVKTNSLLPGILIHFVNNLIAFSLMVFSESDSFYFSEIIINPLSYVFLIIISLGVLILGAYWVEKKGIINQGN
jgi:membrane protease YdiL (CAAX protease family)